MNRTNQKLKTLYKVLSLTVSQMRSHGLKILKGFALKRKLEYSEPFVVIMGLPIYLQLSLKCLS